MHQQTLSYPGTLFEEIREHLLSPAPDPVQLQDLLSMQLGLNKEDARLLIYQVVGQLNAALFPPITKLEIIHTEGCNLACTYCFEKNMIGYKKISPEITRAAIDLLIAYSLDEEMLNITHFGGEPTLNFKGIQLATEYAEQRVAALGKRLRFDMTSNGVLLNDEMVNYFAEHKISVLLSIDGLESSHNRYRVDRQGRGTFAQAMHGLNVLKRVQPWIGVKMTVMPEHAYRLFEDVVGLYERGVNQFLIGHATGISWSNAALAAFGEQWGKVFQWYRNRSHADLRISEFEQEPEEGAFFGCPAGRSSISVAISGQISPCSKIMGLNSQQLIGKLGDVFFGLTHFRNRTNLVTCSALKSACESKGIAESFQGGCFAVNYAEHGNLFQPSLQEHTVSLLKRAACIGCSTCAS